ncbi:hypothetical protein [Tomitella gaofuii]|uniref:hypothetical protein n=1 Tax=Tomitella gaofuii TaxID=2760083 RepID=UPI0015F86AF9|nr:hypothetical protein [Tomitella gaofuii]
MPELRDKSGTPGQSSDKGEQKRAPVGLIVSATLILVIIGAAAALIVPRMIGNDDGAATGTVTPAASGPSTTASVDELFPAPPQRDQLGRVTLVAGDDYPFGRALPQHGASGDLAPSAQPGGLVLMQYLRSSTWVSETAGPESIDERGVPHGFAHTPQGAALAASWLWALSSNLDTAAAAIDDGFMLTGGEQVPEQSRREYKGMAAPMAAPMAFKVDWNPRLTNVAMAFTTKQGKWLVASIDVEWRDGDWALRGFTGEQSTVASLGPGFVQWQAVR